MAFMIAAAVAIVVVLAVPQVGGALTDQSPWLPWIAIAIAAVVPLAFLVWYSCSYAEVQRGRLRLKSLRSKQVVDLRTLTAAEVYSRARRPTKHAQHQLSLWMEDASGRELHLPLNSWQDEELLMARVLRATVDRKVRIDGDPELVENFTGLLASYKSWDRQQAAA